MFFPLMASIAYMVLTQFLNYLRLGDLISLKCDIVDISGDVKSLPFVVLLAQVFCFKAPFRNNRNVYIIWKITGLKGYFLCKVLWVKLIFKPLKLCANFKNYTFNIDISNHRFIIFSFNNPENVMIIRTYLVLF